MSDIKLVKKDVEKINITNINKMINSLIFKSDEL